MTDIYPTPGWKGPREGEWSLSSRGSRLGKARRHVKAFNCTRWGLWGPGLIHATRQWRVQDHRSGGVGSSRRRRRGPHGDSARSSSHQGMLLQFGSIGMRGLLGGRGEPHPSRGMTQ